MDKKEALRVAQAYASLVRERYEGSRVFLFGSFSKGNFHQESDIDIAVVLDDYPNSREVQLDLMRLRRKVDSRIEPHPFREHEFEVSNPLAFEILEYGEEIMA